MTLRAPPSVGGVLKRYLQMPKAEHPTLHRGLTCNVKQHTCQRLGTQEKRAAQNEKTQSLSKQTEILESITAPK